MILKIEQNGKQCFYLTYRRILLSRCDSAYGILAHFLSLEVFSNIAAYFIEIEYEFIPIEKNNLYLVNILIKLIIKFFFHTHN